MTININKSNLKIDLLKSSISLVIWKENLKKNNKKIKKYIYI